MLSDVVRPEDTRLPPPRRRAAGSVVLVDRNPCAELLVDRRGRPVWPIRNEDDWQAVSLLCRLRALEIRQVTGRPGSAMPATAQSSGVVRAIGDPAVHEVARLYAHLTGRGYLAVDPADADLLPSAAVVVTTFEYLTSNLLHSLYSRPSGHAVPGLVCASNPGQLRRQALVRSLLARPLMVEEEAPWRALFPTEPIGTHRRGDFLVFGGSSSLDEVRDALATRSGLLVVATHSDGVDAMLGPSLAWCGIHAEDLAAHVAREPACLASGFCHRFGVPVPEVRELGHAIAPSDLSAQVLLFDTCFGTLAADAPISSERGMGRHLAENLEIGAFATSWELTVLDPGKLQGLVADLRRGMALGRAIARFNRSPAARRTATRLALFGDPRTRLKKRSILPAGVRSGTGQAAQRSRLAAPIGLPESNELNEVGFSRACLEHGIADLSAQLAACGPQAAERIKRHLETAESALGQVRLFERSCREGTSPGNDLAAPALRRALIEDAFIRRPLDDWKAFAEKTDWADTRCAGCGAPAWVGVLALRVPGVARRRVVLCPHCGVAEDMPEHVRLNFRFDHATGTCTLLGDPPRREWSAALIQRTRIEANDRMWDWPAAPGGEPCERMPLPEPLPGGPVKLAVILAHGGWIAWTGREVAGGTGASNAPILGPGKAQ